MDTQNGVWSTPKWLFDKLNDEFKFTLDAAALPENAKCDRYLTPLDDALSLIWAGSVWCNPPYGREIGQWVKKAHDEVFRFDSVCDRVVMLLPAKVETNWWWNYALAGQIRFIKGRVSFGDRKGTGWFASAIVVFDPFVKREVVWWDVKGR